MVVPIPSPSPKELKEYAESLAGVWKRYTQHRQTTAAQAGRRDKRLAALLTLLYPNALRPYNDAGYPAALFPVCPDQQSDPDSVLGTLVPRPISVDKSLRAAGQSFLKLLQDLGRPLEDLPTYCLGQLRVDPGGIVSLDCGLGTYFDALRTCDALDWELLTTLGRSSTVRIERLVGHLKLRSYIESRGANSLLDPAGRSAAIAVSTVVVFNRGQDYGVICAKRASEGTAIHGDLYHVAPSGMLQPAVGDFEKEFSVVHNIYREYLEELFGLQEVKRSPAVLSFDYFYENPNLRYLHELIVNGHATLLLTGVAVNLLNLRPEICTLLRIETPEWYEKHKVGSDGLSRIELNEEWTSGLSAISFSRSTLPGIPPEDLVPPAGAALYLASKAAEERGWL